MLMRVVHVCDKGQDGRVEIQSYGTKKASEDARKEWSDAKKPAEAAPTGVPALQAFGPEDLFQNITAMRDWQACWLRVIGLIWRDPSLKESLIANPPAFFKQHCNYTVVPTMRIEVTDDTGSTWHYDVHDRSTWTVRPSVLQVFLPAAPTDQKDYALALADFEAVSTLVPFSMFCC
jgi:ribosomally synthesized peptide (two-chain TOMM family)